MERRWFVYLMASRKGGALYVGITNDPARRVWEHKNGKGSEYVRRYKITNLVWLDSFPTPEEAIAFEKKLKRWRRKWKDELIEHQNPDWHDLYDQIPT